MNHVNISAQALGLPDMPTSDQIRLRALSYFNWTWCSRWAELGDEYAIQLQAGRLLAGRPLVYHELEKFVVLLCDYIKFRRKLRETTFKRLVCRNAVTINSWRRLYLRLACFNNVERKRSIWRNICEFEG